VEEAAVVVEGLAVVEAFLISFAGLAAVVLAAVGLAGALDELYRNVKTNE